MLLSFSVANFRSFRERQTLSMVASNRHGDHRDHLTPIPGDENQALPVAALYGANAAGKSNFIKALQALQRFVLIGTKTEKVIDRCAFVLDGESGQRPTEMEVQFVAGGRAYVYGAKFMDDRVAEEWLSELRSGGEQNIFQRTTDESHVTGIEYSKDLNSQEKLQALKVVQGQPNQLFLNTVRALLTPTDQGPVLGSVLQWFEKDLLVIGPGSKFDNLAGLLVDDESFHAFVAKFLREVATGVYGLRVSVTTMDDARAKSRIPEELLNRLSPGEALTLQGPNSITVTKLSNGRLSLVEVQADHVNAEGKKASLPLGEESDGTQRLLDLLPTLHLGRTGRGGVFVIDEIDRSLHPLLAKGFVRAFLRECAGHDSQIIFSTHDTNFLDLDLLRRDEIWFAEKRLPLGATNLYSLADFKVRTDLKIDKAYLQGRFAAVPPIELEVPDWVAKITADLRPENAREKGKAE